MFIGLLASLLLLLLLFFPNLASRLNQNSIFQHVEELDSTKIGRPNLKSSFSNDEASVTE